MSDIIYDILHFIGESTVNIIIWFDKNSAYLMRNDYARVGLLVILLLVLKLIACSFIGSVAQRRGYTFKGGFLLCFFFGLPITVIYYALSPVKKQKNY